MNLPNTLTILRILSVPVFTIFLLYDHLFYALIIFVAAGITDALDGLIARVYRQKTTIGAYLDPIADKLLLATAFIGMAVLGIVPRWLTVVVITRDVIILLGVLILMLTSHRVDINPTLLSKLTTDFQILTIIVVLLTPYSSLFKGLLIYFIWITTIVTLASGFQYIYIGSKYFNGKGG
jgi:cardiolipin synthase